MHKAAGAIGDNIDIAFVTVVIICSIAWPYFLISGIYDAFHNKKTLKELGLWTIEVTKVFVSFLILFAANAYFSA